MAYNPEIANTLGAGTVTIESCVWKTPPDCGAYKLHHAKFVFAGITPCFDCRKAETDKSIKLLQGYSYEYYNINSTAEVSVGANDVAAWKLHSWYARMQYFNNEDCSGTPTAEKEYLDLWLLLDTTGSCKLELLLVPFGKNPLTNPSDIVTYLYRSTAGPTFGANELHCADGVTSHGENGYCEARYQ